MEQTHIKSFGLRLVLARHVTTPRDLQLRGWWLMQTPEAALVSQEVFLPLDLSKGQLFQTLVVHPKTMKTVLATIQIHP